MKRMDWQMVSAVAAIVYIVGWLVFVCLYQDGFRRATESNNAKTIRMTPARGL